MDKEKEEEMVEPDSCFNEKLPNTPYTIRGYSRSGVGTIVQIPELGWAFDCGMIPDGTTRIKEVFITHNHLDHTLCAPFILSLIETNAPVHFHMPDVMVTPFKEYITSVADLIFLDEPSEKKKKFLSLVLMNGISPDECAEFCTDDNHFVRTFKTFHTSSSIGYAIYELNAEGNFEPLLIYTGDTKADWIETSVGEIASTFKAIITECSFLSYHPNSKKYNHTCWEALERYVRKWTSTTFVLIHTSLRYDHHKDTNNYMSLDSFRKYNNYKNLLLPSRNYID